MANPQTVSERYFKFLETPYITKDGRTAQPAKGAFVELLKSVHADYQPKFDLTACVNGRAQGFKGKVWFWSDLHFSHDNIIRYCDRPFVDSPTMNDVLIKNCLAKVSADDILVFGGDLTIKDLDVTNAFLRSVPAYTVLVLGNHDAHKRKMLKLEVDEVAACLELEYAGQEVFVSHYPMDEKLLNPGQVNLHGHIHNTEFPTALGSGVRHANMSVETIAFQPRTLAELLDQR